MTATRYLPFAPISLPLMRLYRRGTVPIIRLGHLLVFFFRALAGVPIALRSYTGEFLRLLSNITWGNGSIVVGISSGGSTGSYLHYFSLMLAGKDILYSLLKAVIFVWVASTIQCYYGYYASGGPEGVGVAAGHGMRASITVVIIINMLLTMALWGVDAGARFGG